MAHWFSQHHKCPRPAQVSSRPEHSVVPQEAYLTTMDSPGNNFLVACIPESGPH